MPAVLRLAADARDLASDTRGIGRYTRAILRRLILRDDIELTLLLFDPFPLRRRKALRAALRSDRFKLATRARACDAVWHPANGTFFVGSAPSIVTIHDAVPFRFPAADERLRERQQAPFRRSASSAARVIAVSDFDRSEIREVLDVPAERIAVIYHGVESFFAPGGAGDELPPRLRGRPYFLFVGDASVEPRKNFALLHEAYRAAFPTSDRPALVVVGSNRPLPDDVVSAGVARGDAAGEGDGALRALYRGALAVCVPSYYETFGMPMVEAMACGTPAIASHASCLPEIAADAALFVPPHDARAWGQTLTRIVEDASLRARLRAAGIERASAFDWDESARRHADLFAHL